MVTLRVKPHLIIGPKNNPYMYRWWIFRVGKLPRIYLHKFLRGDDDRALHDHPWWFVSIILKGSYVEIQSGRKVLRRRGSIAFRHATQRHRVVLFPNGQPVWTLFITGPVVRKWGFWCPAERFVPAREFDGCD